MALSDGGQEVRTICAETGDGPSVQWGWQRILSRLDGELLAVLLILGLSWLALAIWVERQAVNLPWCDEYMFVDVCVDRTKLTPEWLWAPQNEHRTPLTRLQLCLAGRLTGWNFRMLLQINLALLALGVGALLWAVRAVRGRSALCDAFLCLVVFNPSAYMTLIMYSYAYGLGLGLLCLALGLAMGGWALGGRWNLLVYFGLAAAVALAAGPAGHVWAVGLCGVVPVLWLQRRSWSWQVLGLVGGLAVVALSAYLLLTIPRVGAHQALLNPTAAGILEVGCKQLVSWMGRPVLEVLWPWASLALVIPGFYLLGRIAVDAGSLFRSDRPRVERITAWLDLTIFLLATLVVIGLVSYGRGRSELWSSRYHHMLAPIGIIVYLLLVRVRAPALPSVLAVVMAVCVGWSWPAALGVTKPRHDRASELVRALRVGDHPLCLLAVRYYDVTGWSPVWGLQHLVHWWMQMRDAGMAAFGRMDTHMPARALLAPSGQLEGSLVTVPDGRAVGGQAVQAQAPASAPGRAIYTVDLPTGGPCQIWVRLCAAAPGQTFSVSVDDGPPQQIHPAADPDYAPVLVFPALQLDAGRHRLIVTLSSPHLLLDLVEVVRKP
jgi:hypothetical protein